MKRKFSVFNNTRSKHPILCIDKLPTRYIHPYISATKTRNYMLNDSLVDWLKIYGKNSGTSKL